MPRPARSQQKPFVLQVASAAGLSDVVKVEGGL